MTHHYRHRRSFYSLRSVWRVGRASARASLQCELGLNSQSVFTFDYLFVLRNNGLYILWVYFVFLVYRHRSVSFRLKRADMSRFFFICPTSILLIMRLDGTNGFFKFDRVRWRFLWNVLWHFDTKKKFYSLENVVSLFVFYENTGLV